MKLVALSQYVAVNIFTKFVEETTTGLGNFWPSEQMAKGVSVELTLSRRMLPPERTKFILSSFK